MDPPGNHAAVVVTVGGLRYLVDVGNGIDVGAPVPLDTEGCTYAEGARYFVAAAPADDDTGGADDDRLALWVERPGQPSFVRYSFRPVHAPREAFAEAVAFTEGDPDSVFVQRPLATLRTAHGRISLSKHNLTTTFDGEKRKEPLEGPEQRTRLLREAFGIRPEARMRGFTPGLQRSAASALRGAAAALRAPRPMMRF